jgi:glycosyltransferase involved in cell wall biosynthesis
MEPSREADVSVILTCYNEGEYIGAAVRSVIEQTWQDRIQRIVIADDGSATETIAVLKALEGWDKRIQIVYGPGGAGLPAQRNLAISMIDSPFVAILDGDDVWVRNKLELQLPALVDSPDVSLVYSGFFTFPDGDIAKAAPAPVLDLSQAADLTRTYFLNDPPIIPSTIIARLSSFRACGGFNARILVFEDTDFYLRLSRLGRFAFVPTPLLYKRNRGTSITGGRKDLMAHHAFVALKAASEEPRLLPLVPRRLAERARKLGNQRFLMCNFKEAVPLYALAVRLNPLNVRAWISLVTACAFPRFALRLLGPKAQVRQIALGAPQQ